MYAVLKYPGMLRSVISFWHTMSGKDENHHPSWCGWKKVQHVFDMSRNFGLRNTCLNFRSIRTKFSQRCSCHSGGVGGDLEGMRYLVHS